MVFDEFKLWFAKSITQPNFSQADDDMKMEDSRTSGHEIQAIWCIPERFSKRVTDVSQAISNEKKSPDTGIAVRTVSLRFTESRTESSSELTILERLINMVHQKADSGGFDFGRFGLECEDNPDLDCTPNADAGYKLISYGEEPNAERPALKIWNIELEFEGSHFRLGT